MYVCCPTHIDFDGADGAVQQNISCAVTGFLDVELEPVTVNVEMKTDSSAQEQAEELEKDDTPFFVV